MSPKPADPAVRTALIDTAARIVATEGRAALTLRGLAKAVGTSTMAVYTHFGSMDQLRREVRLEGFARLRDHLDSVPETPDPLTDLCLLGAAYYTSATREPNLYRIMFVEAPLEAADVGTCLDTFMYLVRGVERCLQAGHFPAQEHADPAEPALEVWALTHGLVSLQLAQLIEAGEALAHLWTSARSLFLGWGATPEALRRSMDDATRRLGEAGEVAEVGEVGGLG